MTTPIPAGILSDSGKERARAKMSEKMEERIARGCRPSSARESILLDIHRSYRQREILYRHSINTQDLKVRTEQERTASPFV